MTRTTRRFRPGMLATAVALTALLGGATLVATLHSGAAQADAVPAAPPALPVPVATVSASEVSAWSEFSGRLEAVDRVELRSRAAGTVQAVHFREGSLVAKGALLFTIDPAPYGAAVERAQAQVAAAQARLTHAGAELQRAQRLWDDRAIAQREFDERANAQREADANLRAARAALQSAQLDLDHTEVRAPIAGRIGRAEVTPGNLVAAGPGAPVLTTLVSVNPIYASFDADEKVVLTALQQLSRQGTREQTAQIPVRMGTSATADLPHLGRLQLVDNQVDPRSGTIRVRAVFANPDGHLIPGQYARLEMGAARAGQVLLVNERAVGTDQDKRYVMVVDAENRARWREIRLGASVNGLRVVSEGLAAGERIVVGGLQRVRPGALLAPRPVPMGAKPELQAKA